MRRSLRILLTALAVASTVTASATAAWANFSSTASASQTLASATLQAPSGLSANTGCSLVIIGPKVDLQWTATPSLFASGYKVERWRGATLQSTVIVTPRTTTTLTQTGLSSGTTYTWKVYASYQSWTSALISASGTTPSLCL